MIGFDWVNPEFIHSFQIHDLKSCDTDKYFEAIKHWTSHYDINVLFQKQDQEVDIIQSRNNQNNMPM